MRTLTISSKNIGLRFFLWVWEANINKLNICKLFWGTTMLPIGLIIKRNNRPFHYLSNLSAIYLTYMVIPCIILGEYIVAMPICLLILCSMLYNYMKREAIAKKYSQEEEQSTDTSDDCQFSERTERILNKIFDPLFWLIGFAIETYERFYETRPGEQIVGLLSLFYFFIKSVKQKTCLLVKVE